MRTSLFVFFLASFVWTTAGYAQETAPPPPKDATADTAAKPDGAKPDGAKADDAGLGLNVDLQLSSAYVFRGLNVFQKDGQMNQNMLAAPGVTWTVGKTGISVGYWGAFQLTGDNRSANTDNAVNMEQDLWVSYEKKLSEKLTVKGLATFYILPFADLPDISVPTWVEPMASATYDLGMATAGLAIAYFMGLQSDLRDFSYLYVNPTLEKSIKVLNKEVSFKVGYGYKQFKEGNDHMSNVHDLLFTVGTSFTVGPVYLKPGIGVAWTNIEGADSALNDGLVVWGWLNVGMDK